MQSGRAFPIEHISSPIRAEAPVRVKTDRLLGVDVARAFAIIGMLAVHLGPRDITDLGGRLYALPHGRASILFVLVAGIGVALLSGRAEGRFDARLKLASFAILLLPLGLALQRLDHSVAVILHHYGALYLVGILALGVPRRAILALAAGVSILGPLAYLAGRMLAPAFFGRRTVELGDGPGEVALGLLVSGPYPLIVWSAPLLWGLWIGRLDLRDGAVRMRLIAIGAGLALLGLVLAEILVPLFGEPGSVRDWRHVLTHTPHSQMPFWLMSALGSAMAVLGAALVLADRFARVALPLAILGQSALSVYVAHLLALHWWSDALRHDSVLPAVGSVLLLTAMAMALAALWRTVQPRGPLETAMQLPWMLISRTRQDRARPLRPPSRGPA